MQSQKILQVWAHLCFLKGTGVLIYTRSTMHDNDPEVCYKFRVPIDVDSCLNFCFRDKLLDEEKKRNLSGTQHRTSTPLRDEAPGWNESLASASEASVKVSNLIL